MTRFGDFLCNKLSHKSSPNYWWLFGLFLIMLLLCKKCAATFWPIFGGNLVTFYSIIWSHCPRGTCFNARNWLNGKVIILFSDKAFIRLCMSLFNAIKNVGCAIIWETYHRRKKFLFQLKKRISNLIGGWSFLYLEETSNKCCLKLINKLPTVQNRKCSSFISCLWLCLVC